MLVEMSENLFRARARGQIKLLELGKRSLRCSNRARFDAQLLSMKVTLWLQRLR